MEHETCKVCGFPHDGSDHSDCVFALKQEVDRLRGDLNDLRKQFEDHLVVVEIDDGFLDAQNTRAEMIP
jgi:hypothetical protein